MAEYKDIETPILDILGQPWTIVFASQAEDKLLEDCDGYCDKTTHRIVVSSMSEDCTLGDPIQYKRKLIRHEIIHAYLYESGLHGCVDWNGGDSEHPEMLVDWFAVQLPKIVKTCEMISAI